MDPATLAAARLGHRAAQASLLRELQDPWYRLCFSLLGNHEKAMDATQESALRFLRQLLVYRGDSTLKTWALGIAINVCREMRRSARPACPLEDQQTSELGDRSGEQPSAAAEEHERRQYLHEILDGLPHRQREAVILRFFEELSVEQTATVMNCAVGTVKATVHQALRSMKQRLQQLV